MYQQFLEYTFYGNSTKEWGIALLYVLGAFLLGRFLLLLNRKVLRKWAKKTSLKYDDIMLEMLETPLVFALMLVGIWLGIKELNVPPALEARLGQAYRMLIILNIAWFVSRLSNAFISEYITKKSASPNFKIDRFLVQNFKRTLSVVIWLVATLAALKSAGMDIRALLATFGIGGIAVALAAQDTLKNVIGGITILIDRPFKLGERIKANGFDGVVEHIGMRSTRLRTLENRLVVIPNNKMVDVAIENVSREPARKVTLNLGLTYQTSSPKMQEALSILKALPKQVRHIGKETFAAFTEFGDFALTITFIYYIDKKLETEVLAISSEVNSAILSAFNQAGLDFAYPTQTLFITNNNPLNP
jgi:MscS family membrane protein